MTNLRMTAVASLAALWVAGCGGSAQESNKPDSSTPANPATGTRQMTLHVPEMADRLELL